MIFRKNAFSSHRAAIVAVGLCPLLFIGFGCSKVKTPTVSAPKPPTATTTAETSFHIGFMPDDTFEVWSLKGATLLREVGIRQFAPQHSAEISWRKSNDPKPDIAKATGTISEIDLWHPHALLTPAMWRPGDRKVTWLRSGLWLADDAFFELARTKRTGIDLNFVSPEIEALMSSSPQAQQAYKELETRALEESKTIDPNMIRQDAESATRRITINGSEVEVPVIRARNWFGVFEVMDDRQNPLILSLVLDPDPSSKIDKTSAQFQTLQRLVSYQITNIVSAPAYQNIKK